MELLPVAGPVLEEVAAAAWTFGAGSPGYKVVRTRMPIERGQIKAYQALEVTNQEGLEDLASLVTVSNILECLSGILSTNIHQDLLTTSGTKLVHILYISQLRWPSAPRKGCSRLMRFVSSDKSDAPSYCPHTSQASLQEPMQPLRTTKLGVTYGCSSTKLETL
jgi:hypothetical protein